METVEYTPPSAEKLAAVKADIDRSFPKGAKVKLTGDGWSSPAGPKVKSRGSVVEIIDSKLTGGIWEDEKKQQWFVTSEPGHHWGGELVVENETLALQRYAAEALVVPSLAAQLSGIKDSGTRRDFGTGSVRDAQTGKGRMDLLPVRTLLRLAKHFEKGSKKYGDRNWEKGQPLSVYYDSGLRHLLKAFGGLTDEDHWTAGLWNIMCLIETMERIERGLLPKELNDLPPAVFGNDEF